LLILQFYFYFYNKNHDFILIFFLKTSYQSEIEDSGVGAELFDIINPKVISHINITHPCNTCVFVCVLLCYAIFIFILVLYEARTLLILGVSVSVTPILIITLNYVIFSNYYRCRHVVFGVRAP
jgi:hypothetical protein